MTVHYAEHRGITLNGAAAAQHRFSHPAPFPQFADLVFVSGKINRVSRLHPRIKLNKTALISGNTEPLPPVKPAVVAAVIADPEFALKNRAGKGGLALRTDKISHFFILPEGFGLFNSARAQYRRRFGRMRRRDVLQNKE
jgi:hypothetical protein